MARPLAVLNAANVRSFAASYLTFTGEAARRPLLLRGLLPYGNDHLKKPNQGDWRVGVIVSFSPLLLTRHFP